MKTNTVTLRISRSEYIETSKDIALIRLDTIQHIIGQPVMISYNATNGDLETITAIGVKNGQGRDCYSIVSTSKESIINGVLEELPDVSTLVNGARYISKYNGDWALVYIQGGQIRQVSTSLLNDPQIFRDLETGFRWFYVNGKYKREDDFLQRNSILDLFKSEFYKIHKPEINVKIVQGDYFIKGVTIVEPCFEIKVVDHAGIDLTSSCTISISSDLYGQESIKQIEGNKYTIYGNLTEDTVYTIKAIYNISSETVTITKTIKADFGNLTYYGDIVDPNNIELTDLTSLAWNGKGDLTLTFNLNNEYSVVYIPDEFFHVNTIYDKNGLNYIDDYTIYSKTISGVLYKVLLKNDKVKINNFKQVFTYE